MSRPSSPARRCNSSFHRRTREPFEPPPSAVMTRRSALGYLMEPTSVHQRRSVCTAKAAVSLSTPTPTKALVGGEVVDAVGNSAPQLLDQEIVDAHILEFPLGPPFAPRVLEIPDQLLFFVSTEITG